MRLHKFLIPFLLMVGLTALHAQEKIYIKVVYRDFNGYNATKSAGGQTGHSDFEAFDAKYGDADTNPERCGSLHQPAFASGAASPATYFSWFQTNYMNTGIGTYSGWVTAASRDVYPTLGMVQGVLSESDGGEKYWADDLIDMEGREIPAYKPTRERIACHNTNFDDWFKDKPGVNVRKEDLLELHKIPGTKKYTLEFSHWHQPSTVPGTTGTQVTADGVGNDFVPLTQYGVEGGLFGCQQSTNWVGNVGPDQYPAGSANCVGAGQIGPRNYGFTMESHLMFSYFGTGDEVFEFQGDDDLWIFIDGELVIDVGGTHLPIYARFDVQQYAQQKGWEANSLHRMDIFFAERQSNGSNLKLTVTLNDLKVPENLGPQVTAAQVSDGDDAMVWVFLNTKLHPDVINNINNGVFQDAFLIKRAGAEHPFYITSIKEVATVGAEKRKGYKYEVTFVTEGGPDIVIWPVSSDSISVNPNANHGDPLGTEGLGVTPGVNAWMYGANGMVSDSKVFQKFDLIAAQGGGLVEPVEQKPALENLPFGQGSSGADNIAGNGAAIMDWLQTNGQTFDSKGRLDVAKGGEIILTALDPNSSWAIGLKGDDALSGAFSDDPSLFLIAPFTDLQGNQAFINGVSNSTSSNGFWTARNGEVRGDPLCRATVDPATGRTVNSCLQMAFLTKGPFRMNVRVFDHLGNFVSRYSQEVTKEQLQQVQATSANQPLGAGQCAPEGAAAEVADTQNGVSSAFVMASLNVYPFSQTGRMLGTGVYIMQVDIIQKYHAWCQVEESGSVLVKETPGNRSSMVLRVPYRHP